MEPIFHITTEALWERACQEGALSAPSLESEGFLHGSTRAQVLATAGRYFRGVSGLLLVELDTTSVASILKMEAPSPPSAETEGLLFPHLYGAVPLASVSRWAELKQEGDAFVWPATWKEVSAAH